MRGKGGGQAAPRSVLITAGIGLAMGLAVFAARGGFRAETDEVLLLALCDAFTVPGLILTGLGLLSIVSGQGAFDGINFTARKAFSQVLGEKRREAMPRTYYDYVTARRKKQAKRPKTTLYTGLAFLACAIAALIFYLSAAPM